MNQLCDTQTSAQRLISKHIGAYPLWTSGEIHASRWERLVEKFSRLYETDITPSARQWRKRRGQCSAHLVAAPLPGEKLRWVLLVTEHGAGTVKDTEKLRDARSERMVWGDYILILTTKARAFGGGVHWTWFLTPTAERRETAFLTTLAQSAGIARQPKRLTAFTDTLMKRPLHAGVRGQVAKMMRRAQKVWRRHSGGMPWPGPDPATLPHVGSFRRVGEVVRESGHDH